MLETVASRIYGIAAPIIDLLPFYTTNIIRRSLDKHARSILDVGCGYGGMMERINKHRRLFSLGIDGYIKCITAAKRKNTHDDYVLCDVRFIPFRKKSFDIVVCLDVIEHLSKAEGFKLIGEMGEIAARQVIISTPVGFVQHGVVDNSPLQIHKSGWSPQEFRKMGYKVRGFGFRFVYGNTVSTPLFRRYSSFILSCILAPVPYYAPKVATGMVCVKNIDEPNKE